MSWRDLAACAAMDTTLFFGQEGESGAAATRRVAKAKAVCLPCPVLTECRAYALDRPEKYGLWGSMSEGERSAERKNAKRRTQRRETAAERRPDRDQDVA